MIKPYNTINRITKENSMFNKLPVNYDLHTDLEHIIHIYDTTLILNLDLPKDKIRNEVYYNPKVNFKKRKTMKDVFKFLYN